MRGSSGSFAKRRIPKITEGAHLNGMRDDSCRQLAKIEICRPETIRTSSNTTSFCFKFKVDVLRGSRAQSWKETKRDWCDDEK